MVEKMGCDVICGIVEVEGGMEGIPVGGKGTSVRHRCRTQGICHGR